MKASTQHRHTYTCQAYKQPVLACQDVMGTILATNYRASSQTSACYHDAHTLSASYSSEYTCKHCTTLSWFPRFLVSLFAAFRRQLRAKDARRQRVRQQTMQTTTRISASSRQGGRRIVIIVYQVYAWNPCKAIEKTGRYVCCWHSVGLHVIAGCVSELAGAPVRGLSNCQH